MCYLYTLRINLIRLFFFMVSYIESSIDQVVQVITNEGRVFTGFLISFDQSMNIVLKDCIEKVYSKEEALQLLKMGVYMIRGDNISIISRIDMDLEENLNLDEIKVDPLPSMKIHL